MVPSPDLVREEMAEAYKMHLGLDVRGLCVDWELEILCCCPDFSSWI